MDTDDVLADRVDIEPPIFKGCSSSELLFLLVGAIVAWVPLSLAIAAIAGRLFYALGLLTVGVMASVYLGATQFQRIKRNRPDHYYVHAAMQRLVRHGLWSCPLIWRSGYWDIARDQRAGPPPAAL